MSDLSRGTEGVQTVIENLQQVAQREGAYDNPEVLAADLVTARAGIITVLAGRTSALFSVEGLPIAGITANSPHRYSLAADLRDQGKPLVRFTYFDRSLPNPMAYKLAISTTPDADGHPSLTMKGATNILYPFTEYSAEAGLLLPRAATDIAVCLGHLANGARP